MVKQNITLRTHSEKSARILDGQLRRKETSVYNAMYCVREQLMPLELTLG